MSLTNYDLLFPNASRKCELIDQKDCFYPYGTILLQSISQKALKVVKFTKYFLLVCI